MAAPSPHQPRCAASATWRAPPPCCQEGARQPGRCNSITRTFLVLCPAAQRETERYLEHRAPTSSTGVHSSWPRAGREIESAPCGKLAASASGSRWQARCWRRPTGRRRRRARHPRRCRCVLQGRPPGQPQPAAKFSMSGRCECSVEPHPGTPACAAAPHPSGRRPPGSCPPDAAESKPSK